MVRGDGPEPVLEAPAMYDRVPYQKNKSERQRKLTQESALRDANKLLMADGGDECEYGSPLCDTLDSNLENPELCYHHWKETRREVTSGTQLSEYTVDQLRIHQQEIARIRDELGKQSTVYQSLDEVVNAINTGIDKGTVEWKLPSEDEDSEYDRG